jgi:hypothetical protein
MKNGFSIAEYPNDRLLVQNLHTTNLREKKTKQKIVSIGCKQRHKGHGQLGLSLTFPPFRHGVQN